MNKKLMPSHKNKQDTGEDLDISDIVVRSDSENEARAKTKTHSPTILDQPDNRDRPRSIDCLKKMFTL